MTSPEQHALRDARAKRWLGLLFFLSGGTALAYQTVWARALHLLFGTSTPAIGTVLAVFMGGLALGSWLVGKLADRHANPLALYGRLEIGIGLYALAFPGWMAALEPLMLAIHRAAEPGPLGATALRVALAAITLLPPTIAMGGTLPLLARFATDDRARTGESVGRLYAINTAGALAGAAFVGFVALPALGRAATNGLAVAVNLALGVGALWLARGLLPAAPTPPRAAAGRGPIALAMAVAGACALTYEVAWTRLLGLVLGGSTYTFSLMLVAFLLGLAVGGPLGGRWADAARRRGGRDAVLGALAWTELGVAGGSLLAMGLFPELPVWFVWLSDRLDVTENPRATWLVSSALAIAAMSPPAVLMGAHLPLAIRAAADDEGGLGEPVGAVVAANTLGGALGAAAAGLWWLPTLGVQHTLWLAALGNVAIAVGLWSWRARALRGLPVLVAAVVASFFRPTWEPTWLAAGLFHHLHELPDRSRAGLRAFANDRYDLLYFAEGPTSVVTVAQSRRTGHRWLTNNGKVDASTSTDMPTQTLCALLGAAHVEGPFEGLVIGLASGVTAGALTTLPPLRHLEVVEIEPRVVEAARYFDTANLGVLDDPRVTITVDDGRHRVLLARPGRWQLVVSEPPNPWLSGVANLFTRDFLEIGRRRLAPGGVWSQWVQLYGLTERDLHALLRTVADVFPHLLVYTTLEGADLVIIGAETPLVADQAHAERLFAHPGSAQLLGAVGLPTPADLLTTYLFDRDAVLDLVGAGPLNTDDNLLIEHNAPLHLHAWTRTDHFGALRARATLPALGADPEAWIALARAHHRRSDPRARDALRAALDALPHGDPRREDWMVESARW